MRVCLQCYMWVGWMDGLMDGMVIIGHRYSESAFGANNFGISCETWSWKTANFLKILISHAETS